MTDSPFSTIFVVASLDPPTLADVHVLRLQARKDVPVVLVVDDTNEASVHGDATHNAAPWLTMADRLILGSQIAAAVATEVAAMSPALSSGRPPTIACISMTEALQGADATGDPPTPHGYPLVFSLGYSEAGDRLATHLRAFRSVLDPMGAGHSIRSADVRANPIGLWHHLPAVAKGTLALRVVIVGAESTGKTTLCETLVEHLRSDSRSVAWLDTAWVPEVGRQRTIELLAEAQAAADRIGEPPPTMDDLRWSTEEFIGIAHRQNLDEDHAARTGGPVLLCDTDAFATGIWHERYMGSRSPAVEALARHHPLYLVPHPDDVPFTQDGIRDGEHLRPWMHDRFIEDLTRTGRRYVTLRGTRSMRETTALAAITALARERFGPTLL